MRATRIIVAALSVLTLPAAAISSPILLGGTNNGVLYNVDPTTGEATNPRETGLRDLLGLGLSPQGTLFALQYEDEFYPSGGSIYAIDARAGTATLIGSPRLARGMRGLAWDGETSSLLSYFPYLGAGAGDLIRIDPGTGVGTTVGPVGWLTGLAMDHEGTLWGLTQSELVVIDKTSGQTVGSTPLSDPLWGVVGFAFDESGRAFLSPPSVGGSSVLYALDTSSGMLTAIGPTGVEHGLTSLVYVPEPSALLLGALGVLLPFIRSVGVGRRGDERGANRVCVRAG